MKFCSKCGNQLQDDMNFCQKCGTKFIENINVEITEAEEKLSKLKSYNLILDSDVITWNYCRSVSGTELGQISLHQDKFSEEMTKLISQIIDELQKSPNPGVENELYTFVFDMSTNMMKSSTKMFSNYSGFQELFNQGNLLCQKGLIAPQKFLNDMIQTDRTYKLVAGLQVLQASMLKAALDSKKIKQNPEYTTKAKILAENYMNCFKADIDRYINHYAYPSEQYLIESQWDIFNRIVAGLDYEYIKWIEKNIWDYAKKNQDKSTIDKIDRKRETFLIEFKRQETEEYLKSNPKIKDELEKLYANLETIKKEVRCTENSLESLKEKIDIISNSVINCEIKINTNCKNIERQKKKIFGKQNAEQRITSLENENERLRNQIKEFETDKKAFQEQLHKMIDKVTELKTTKNTVVNQIKEINPYY